MSYYSNANPALVDLADPTARLVVELGCGTGATATALRRINPTARFIGIELMAEPAAQARAVMETVIEGDIEAQATFDQLDRSLGDQRIDLLVIGDVLEHLKDPWSVMRQFHQRMAAGGRLVLSLPNAAHWSLIRRQLKGDWTYTDSGLLDRTHLRFFTRTTGQRMLREAGWHTTAAHPRQFDHPDRAPTIAALTDIAPALGIPAEAMRRDLDALQWVHCASAQPAPPPRRIHAIGIASALDSLTTVRLKQPLDSLQAMGRAEVRLHRGQFTLPDPSEAPGILISYRYHPDAADWARLHRLMDLGWLFLHDVDDHPEYLRAQTRTGFRSIREAHAVTVSTPALAECCRQWNPHVFVVPNQIRRLAPPAQALNTATGPAVFLGAMNRADQWAEGTRDAVLATLRAAAMPTTVIADADFAAALGDLARLLPLQRYGAFRARLAEANIALLPLLPGPFTACKSDLKIIECLASGVVPVCSAYAASRTDVPAELLLIAETPQDWQRQLLRLCDDDFRAGMQAAGYDWVGRNRMWGAAAPRLDALYGQLLTQRKTLDTDRRARLASALGDA